MVFNGSSAGTYASRHGWIEDAAASRRAGASEVGLIAEFDMPVFRGNPKPPARNAFRWVPGPDKTIIMFKRCVGLIMLNDYTAKLIKPFTTQSGTDLETLRRPGKLKDFIQVIRSPQEDGVQRERGMYDILMFQTFDVESVNWNIAGPRFMHIDGTYAHPHSRPYRIVGHLKEGYDENVLVDIHHTAAATAISQAHAAFKERSSNPAWFMRYRDSSRPINDISTAVDQVRFSPSSPTSMRNLLTWSRHVHSRWLTAMQHRFKLATSSKRPSVSRLKRSPKMALRVS